MSYTIKVKGFLNENWSDWLGASLTSVVNDENGAIYTVITVTDIDQPALFGILDRIRDLNMTLLSVMMELP